MNLINILKQKEETAIIGTLAMMSYIPSIQRVLEKGNIDVFQKIMVKEVKKLKGINSQDDFDSFHDSIIQLLMKEIIAKKEKPPAYGQVQKPLNVFLKVFVDWASHPSLKKAEQLRRFLHVPLDSIFMKEIKKYFPDKYEKHVVATYDLIREMLRKTKLYKKFGESGLRILVKPSDFKINRIIYKEMYYGWQHCLRAIYPEKPILLDVLWYLKRKHKY